MKKRIDFVIYGLRGGGAEKVCVTVANELSQKGYNVRIVVLSDKDPVYSKYLDSKIELVFLKVDKVTCSYGKLIKYIKSENPKLFFVFNHDISTMLVILRKLLMKNYKILSRNINTLSLENKYQTSFIKKYILHKKVKYLYKYVDHIVCQSNGMAEDLIDNYKVKKEKITIINNPVSEMFENVEIQMVEKKYENTILFVGRLEKQKGIDILLESFKECLYKNKNIRLKIIGEGSLKGDLIKISKSYGIKEMIEFKNFTNDIIEEYKKASVVVLSSLYEGFPNVLVEAISIGRPIVAFDCKSGPSEIIVEGINGFLVEYLNKDKLSNAILKALRYEWNTQEILKTAEKYKRKNIINKYIEVIDNI